MTDTNVNTGPAVNAEPGTLFAAVSGLALHIGGDLELAPKDENESEVDLSIRLLAELEPRAKAAVEEVAALKRSIAGHKGLTTRERRKVEALEAQLPAKPRKFDVLTKPLAAGELLALIDHAETVGIAFIGPKGVEVDGLAPRSIDGGGEAWQLRFGRLFLNVPSMIVHGPEPTARKPREIAGYALLIDGEHVTTAPRDQLRLAAGGRYELKGDVVFG